MFRKLLDKAKNINIGKIQKDTEIQAKKMLYYTKQAQKDLKNTITNNEYFKNISLSKENLDSIKDKLKIKKLDELYTNKIDKTNENINSKLSNIMKALKLKASNSKNIPGYMGSTLYKFGKETNDFFKENYSYSKWHITNYISANKKYFKYRKNQYTGFFRKQKIKFLIMGFGVIFIYAVGSNIPNAIVNYRIAQEQTLRNK